MTWLQFILWLAAAYACYYLVMIFIDASKTARLENPGEQTQLISFENNSQPEKVDMIIETGTDEPVSSASGAVTLKGLFDLARTESIHYTAAVSF